MHATFTEGQVVQETLDFVQGTSASSSSSHLTSFFSFMGLYVMRNDCSRIKISSVGFQFYARQVIFFLFSLSSFSLLGLDVTITKH